MKKAFIVIVVVVLSIVGSWFLTSHPTIKPLPYGVIITPWSGSYTPQMDPDLFKVVNLSWIKNG